MNRELLRTHQRRVVRWAWGIIVALVIIFAASWLFQAAASIRTHTLPVGEIRLSVSSSKYLVNEPITFTIQNNYNSPVYLTNSCPQAPLKVYRLVNSVWTRIYDTAAESDCPDENRNIMVPAFGSVNGNFAAWHNLFSQPGRYRVVAYVEYYAALPYQEFDVIAAPPIAPVAAPTVSTQTVLPQPAPTKYVPKDYMIDVDARGNYNTTKLNLNVGDTLTIFYAEPREDEVRTSFRLLATTTTSIGSMTVDSEIASRTVTLTSRGTWTYRADDHNGNSGTLTVN